MLIIISCCIATPIACYYLDKWLGNYQYHIRISTFVFLAAAVGIAYLDHSKFQAIKSGLAGPIRVEGGII